MKLINKSPVNLLCTRGQDIVLKHTTNCMIKGNMFQKDWLSENMNLKFVKNQIGNSVHLLAPTGALYAIMCHYWSAVAQLFQIFTHSIDSFYDYFNDILGTSLRHIGDIFLLFPLFFSISSFLQSSRSSCFFCRSASPEFLRSSFFYHWKKLDMFY